jgi:hypothetical protein
MKGPSHLFFHIYFSHWRETLFFLNPFSLPGISVPDPDLLGSLTFGLPGSGSFTIFNGSGSTYSSEHNINELKIISLSYVYLPVWELFISSVLL